MKRIKRVLTVLADSDNGSIENADKGNNMNTKNTHKSSLWLALALALSVPTAFAGGISPRVQDKVDKNPNEMIEVIITYSSNPNAPDKQSVNDNGGTIRRSFKTINGHAVTVPAQAISGLANNPKVAGITLDDPISLAATAPAESLPTGVGFSFPELLTIPYNGAGVGVVVIDSGARNHADLEIDVKDTVLGFTANDYYGHGNHVAGILGGQGSNGYYAGVAPGVNIISLRALSDLGSGLTSDVIAALDWVLLNKDQYNIRVTNISLGHPVVEAAADDPLVQAAEAVWNAGVVVVASAGNSGRDGYGTITSPGNSPRIITVGSITH